MQKDAKLTNSYAADEHLTGAANHSNKVYADSQL
jgi:hypothetical protein